MTDSYHLSERELAHLRSAHRHTREKRQADRLKAVYLLGRGWTVSQVAEALLLDPGSVRNHFRRYREGGAEALMQDPPGGSEARLNEDQLLKLDVHLSEQLYPRAKDVAHYVAEEFKVDYSLRGITHLLRRLGYVYKKPKLIPGKADGEAQEGFVKEYEKLKENKNKEDPLYFIDATHPHHNPVAGYGWIKRGEDYPIPSNTGRRRLNINGAFNIESLESVVRYDETINAQSTIALFQQLEQRHPQAEKIYAICDNARYYRSGMVVEYLQTSRIELIFLPPYAPNLNLIERYWKFFKKKILCGKYYETFQEFREACDAFFASQRTYISELRSLMTEKFEIIFS